MNIQYWTKLAVDLPRIGWGILWQGYLYKMLYISYDRFTRWKRATLKALPWVGLLRQQTLNSQGRTCRPWARGRITLTENSEGWSNGYTKQKVPSNRSPCNAFRNLQTKRFPSLVKQKASNNSVTAISTYTKHYFSRYVMLYCHCFRQLLVLPLIL